MFPKKFSLNHTNDNVYCVQVDATIQLELLTAIRSGNKAMIQEVVNSLGFDDVTIVYGPLSSDDTLTAICLIPNKEYSATLNDIMEDSLFAKLVNVPRGSTLVNKVATAPPVTSNAIEPRRHGVKATARDFGIQTRKHDWQFKK